VSGFKNAKNVLEAILSIAPLLSGEKARGLLARFHFRGEDVFKPIDALSGGERVRLALARLLLHRHHFLLLDEPTNHLDIQGRQSLLEALRAYNGTLMFVSHDRYFIQEVASRILDLQDGTVRSFYGTYEDYCIAREQGGRASFLLSGRPSEVQNPTGKSAQQLEKEERIQQREIRKEKQRKEQRRQRQLVLLEEEIERLETELKGLETEMVEPSVARNLDRLQQLHEQVTEIGETLKKKYATWDELMLDEESET